MFLMIARTVVKRVLYGAPTKTQPGLLRILLQLVICMLLQNRLPMLTRLSLFSLTDTRANHLRLHHCNPPLAPPLSPPQQSSDEGSEEETEEGSDEESEQDPVRLADVVHQ